jgi:hypothetical protein
VIGKAHRFRQQAMTRLLSDQRVHLLTDTAVGGMSLGRRPQPTIFQPA